jgi:pre-rRNA-processing protein TSR3
MEKHVRIVVYNARQCDPKKCTALKLEHHGLVRGVSQVRFLPKRAVVLNPFSQIAFSRADRSRIENSGLAALDCSWDKAERFLSAHVRGTSRCLPLLIAGNPVNFGKPTKLSTLEALAAALFISGFHEQASELLAMYKWGRTFLELNRELLETYSSAKDSAEVVELQKHFIMNMDAE